MRLVDIDKAIEIWKDKDFIKLVGQEEKAKEMLDLLPIVEMAEDCISREQAQNIMAILLSDYLHDEDREKIENANAEMGELPSVTPTLETSEDCVKREDAKRFLYERLDRLNDDELYDIFSKIIDDMYNELPSVTPKTRWIPVSERLPKENEYIGNVCKYYLIQDEYGDMHVAHLSNVGWIPMDSLKAIGDEVIAWRELPQSYKAESEDEDEN